MTLENMSLVVCKQQKCRPACASAQSDKHLCYSLIGKYHISTCDQRYFNFLACLCSWIDWFELHFLGNPQDRFCCNEAQMVQFMRLCTYCKGLRYFFLHKHICIVRTIWLKWSFYSELPSMLLRWMCQQKV